MTTPLAGIGKARLYNSAFRKRGRFDVVLWDVLHVPKNATFQLTFETTNSTWRQGVWLRTDRGLRVNGEHSSSVDLWQDTSPSVVRGECLTGDGCLSVYNIWDSGRGYRRESQSYSSGMLVEDLPTGRRYHCNDIGFTANFDKLVFRLEIWPTAGPPSQG